MASVKEVLMTAKATSHGGRAGHVKSDDGLIDLNLELPKALGGKGEGGSNPEQLFAAGYSSCFESTLAMIAGQQKIELKDTSVTAEVDFGKTEDGGYGVGVRLHVSLPGVDEATADKLLEAAHTHCPYSKATRGNIDVSITRA